MSMVNALQPRSRCYSGDLCWVQDTGDPGDHPCPASRCQLWEAWDSGEVDGEAVLVLTPPDPDEVAS